MPLRRNFKDLRIVLKLLLAGKFEVSWQRPQSVELVIWDEMGSQHLLDALEPSSHYILRVRNHPIFLHPLIVWETLISALTRRNTHYGIVIKYCKPKAVVTTIDNNSRFHKAAYRNSGLRFVAIQNGVSLNRRFPDEPISIVPGATLNSEYLCFGQNEIDSYHAIGYQFRKIVVMGSLKNALFFMRRNDLKKGFQRSERGDILLISQFRRQLLEPSPIRALEEYGQVVSFLKSYLKSHPELRVSVALRARNDDPDQQAEKTYHQEKFGNLATLIPKDQDWMSSYHATDQFNVVLTASSTLGLESLARGHKTLVCDIRLCDTFADLAFNPDWILSRLDQETFDDATTTLLCMPLEGFVSRNKKSIDYIMIAPDENSISEFQRYVFE